MKRTRINNAETTYSKAYSTVRKYRKMELETREEHELCGNFDYIMPEFKIEKEDGKYQVYEIVK